MLVAAFSRSLVQKQIPFAVMAVKRGGDAYVVKADFHAGSLIGVYLRFSARKSSVLRHASAVSAGA